eukprot:3011961-Alexandrium_andersonii.AAC.1
MTAASAGRYLLSAQGYTCQVLRGLLPKAARMACGRRCRAHMQRAVTRASPGPRRRCSEAPRVRPRDWQAETATADARQRPTGGPRPCATRQ